MRQHYERSSNVRGNHPCCRLRNRHRGGRTIRFNRSEGLGTSFALAKRWPYRGGRTHAVCGVPSEPNVFYVAPVNGGVFKSIDYGRMWQPIFYDKPTEYIGEISV